MVQFKNGKKQKREREMDTRTVEFEKNVFINAPFDKDYVPLLRPLLFTVIYLGYNPRISTESFDSKEARIQKITNLIEESQFSIHDLSRIQCKEKNELYRLNMPFELGIDIGCSLFNLNEKYKNKKCLVLEKDPYRYQKALSDFSGSDIKNHNDEPEDIVRVVRNWFVENGLKNATNATKIWESFNEFMADFYLKRKKEGYKDKDLEMMPIPEYLEFIKEWVKLEGNEIEKLL
jgi:hypothetical protein